MKNEIYASTGAFLGMANGYDYTLLKELAPKIKCDGFEFLIYSVWYSDFEKVMNDVASYGLNIPVVHFDKCIGILLSENTRESVAEAKRNFTRNIEAAKILGAKKAVFHLWGGKNSDLFMAHTLRFVPEFYRECEEAGIELLIENIPARFYGPYFNWCKIYEVYPEAKFIYDTRFGEFHSEHDIIMRSGHWKRVRHIHVSSYERGPMKFWGLLRPILHPGEGALDFDALTARMPEYNYSVSLESPVLSPDGKIDVDKLNRSLGILRDRFGAKK